MRHAANKTGQLLGKQLIQAPAGIGKNIFNPRIATMVNGFNQGVKSITSQYHRNYTTEIPRMEIDDNGNYVANIRLGTVKLRMNLVGRDKEQDETESAGTAYYNPFYYYVVSVWDQLKKPGDVEIGGQEIGAAIEKAARSPAKNLVRIGQASPNSKKRSLGRGIYANAVYALHPNDAKLCYQYIDKYGIDAFIKLFDYNVNWDELEDVIDIISNIYDIFELALPHSPDSNLTYLRTKSLEIAQKLSELKNDPNNKVKEVRASIKRMVKGLKPEEVEIVGHIICPLLVKYGIDDVSLHAHGQQAEEACAVFAAICAHYGINVGIDIVPPAQGRESAFPTIPGIASHFKQKYGVDISPDKKDQEKLDEVTRVYSMIDNNLEAVRVNIANYWSLEDMEFMGMPSGGALYYFNDILASQIFTTYGLDSSNDDDIKIACLICKYTYRDTRIDFGDVNSVTPGHKRVGDITTQKTIDISGLLKAFLNQQGKTIREITDTDMANFFHQKLRSLDLERKYSNMRADLVDAFRNDSEGKNLPYPTPFTDEVRSFLSKKHLKNTLNIYPLNFLAPEINQALLENASSKEAVKQIMLDFFHSNAGEDYFSFLCTRERLAQSPFAELPLNLKEQILSNYNSPEIVKDTLESYLAEQKALSLTNQSKQQEKKTQIAEAAFELSGELFTRNAEYENQIKHKALLPDSKNTYEPTSLLMNSGSRDYPESAKAEELGPKMEAELRGLGYAGEDLFRRKVEGILSKSFFHTNLTREETLSPHGLSKTEFQNEQRIRAKGLTEVLLHRQGVLGIDSCYASVNPDMNEVDPNDLGFKFDPTGKYAQECAEFMTKQNWVKSIAASSSIVTAPTK